METLGPSRVEPVKLKFHEFLGLFHITDLYCVQVSKETFKAPKNVKYEATQAHFKGIEMGLLLIIEVRQDFITWKKCMLERDFLGQMTILLTCDSCSQANR